MDHVAILRKACFKKGEDILGDILAGRKTIESRWVEKISPFEISKQGFGISSAWLVVGDINRVRM